MSEIRANTVSDSAGTGPVTLTGQYAAKAWVNFNGQGTIAARDSFNVSSLTDNGTGNYTTNLTNAMSNSSYSVTVANKRDDTTVITSGNYTVSHPNSYTTASVRMVCGATNGVVLDLAIVNLAFHGDLA